MKPTLSRPRTLLLALLALLAASAAPAASRFHFALLRSLPASGSTVHHVHEVRLWFSEPPASRTVSIRLLDAEGAPVPATEAKQDSDDPKAYAITPASAPAPGTYTVTWRGMGDDGHVVKGDFAFTVATTR